MAWRVRRVVAHDLSRRNGSTHPRSRKTRRICRRSRRLPASPPGTVAVEAYGCAPRLNVSTPVPDTLACKVRVAAESDDMMMPVLLI